MTDTTRKLLKNTNRVVVLVKGGDAIAKGKLRKSRREFGKWDVLDTLDRPRIVSFGNMDVTDVISGIITIS